LFTTPFFLATLLWFWLTHVDRIHIRVKAKEFGLVAQEKIIKFISNDVSTKIEQYGYKQLNAFGEIIAGFSDGLLNKESSINVKYLQNNNTQTLSNKHDNQTQTKIEINEIGINTEILENIHYKEKNDENEDVIHPKKIFYIGKKTRLDTEALEKDLEEDKIHITQPKKSRISLKKR
jgi:hypothetical protein